MRAVGVRLLSVVAVVAAVAWSDQSVALASGLVSFGAPTVVDHQPPFGQTPTPEAVACASSSFCVAFAPGNGFADSVFTSSDPLGGFSTWSHTTLGGFFGGLTGASCFSPSLCVAVDGFGDVISSSSPVGGADTWNVAHVEGQPVRSLNGISCPAVSLCVAVDSGGNVLTSTDPTGGVAAWSVTRVGSPALSGVSCPSVSFCVAIDDQGEVLTSSNPTGGAGAWTPSQVLGSGTFNSVSCPSTSFCAAVGGSIPEPGNVFTTTDPAGGPSAWTAAPVDPHEYVCGEHGMVCPAVLEKISCSSPQLCVATDDTGAVFGSADPAGGAATWSNSANAGYNNTTVSCAAGPLCAVTAEGGLDVSSDPAEATSAWILEQVGGSNLLSGISCASARWCLAVDNAGRALTFDRDGRPTGSAMINPHATPGFPMDVSCPDRSLCVAIDNQHVLTSKHPATDRSGWNSFAVGPTLRGVTCPSRSFCAAFDQTDHIWSTTRPLGGRSAWHKTAVASCILCLIGPSVTALSCPSRSLCVAVDNQGRVIVSRDPTRRAPTWKRALISPHHGLNDVACPSASLCVAIDGDGRAYTSIDPAAGKSAWRVTALGPASPLQHVSCPSTSLCFVTSATATGSSPAVFISENPTGGSYRWSVQNLPFAVAKVSCLSATRCVAVGGESAAIVTVPRHSLRSAIASSLRADLAPPGMLPSIAALLRHGGSRYRVTARSGGRLRIAWHTTDAARTLIATGEAVFSLGGSKLLTLKVTPAGRAVLASRGQRTVSAQGVFESVSAPTIRARRTLTLRP